jgi:hypothetical protein
VIALGNGESYCVFAITQHILNLYLGSGKDDPVQRTLAAMQASRAEDAARRKARAEARAAGTAPTTRPDGLNGTYEDKVYGEATLHHAGGRPVLTLSPAKDLLTGPLDHWHHDTWQWLHADPFLEPGYVTFHFDADHRVTHFTIDLHSPDFHFHKLEFRKKP